MRPKYNFLVIISLTVFGGRRIMSTMLLSLINISVHWKLHC